MSDQDNKDTNPADQAKPLFSIGTRDYKDVDDVVNKITNADNHISTLETERKADKERIEQLEQKLREKEDQSSKLDDVLNKLGEQSSQTDQTGSVDIEALRQDLLKQAADVSVKAATEMEKQKIAQANTATNIEQAKAKFGSDYETKLREEAGKLGYSDEDILKLAAGDAERFKRLFNLDTSPRPSESAPSTNGYRPGGYQPKITDLPNPSMAFNSTGRVSAVQERLKAKLKEKGQL